MSNQIEENNSMGEEGKVVVQTKAGYQTAVWAGKHTAIVDEPIDIGGTNLGPNPYDYLLAGLGGCTSITIRMYADRKGWPLESVVVRLSHQKVDATSCEEAVTEKGRIDLIEREIELTGPLDDEQIGRLMQIADRCPVHRTLHSETIIRSKLVK